MVENFATLFQEFMKDPNGDPTTRKTNYDKFSRQIFAAEIPDLDAEQQEQILTDDFTCRLGETLCYSDFIVEVINRKDLMSVFRVILAIIFPPIAA